MIVEPDFPDHWKVQLLVDRLESPEAVRCLLRLWAHCQNRRTDLFQFRPDQLKSLLKWPGKASQLWEAMTDFDTGWLVEEMPQSVEQSNLGSDVPRGTWWRVRQFRDVNSTLFRNWTRNPSGKSKNDVTDGKKPGPQKTDGAPHGPPDVAPTGTPREPHGHPTDPPKGREGKGLEGIDGKGGDGTGGVAAGAAGGPPPIEFPPGFPESEEQAIAWARGSMVVGDAPDEYLRQVWRQAVGRGCKDAAGALIERFAHWVAARWPKERDQWLAEWKEREREKPACPGLAVPLIQAVAFPWETLARLEMDITPTLSWEEQTPRFRNDLRALWGRLSEERRNEIFGVEAESAKKNKGGAAA